MADDFAKLAQVANYAAGEARRALQENAKLAAQNAALIQDMTALRAALAQVQVTGGRQPDIQRIENIPGRRIPMDMLVEIPIGANVTAMQPGTITIPQNGPFVAVARTATFLSQYAFQQTIDGVQTTFNGRSYGRYRPIHSAWDLNDGQFISEISQPIVAPGAGAPYVASPSNAASFRSMQGDFKILLQDQGSSFRRSNISVPSSMWVKGINNPFELGALDFWERGTLMSFSVEPQHVSNPAFGNVFGFGAPNNLFPFAQSQWDTIEGISDPNTADVTEDPIVRAPNGILVLGFHGYMIVQPAGAGYS